MKQRISPGIAAAIAVVAIAVLGLVGWKLFLAPKPGPVAGTEPKFTELKPDGKASGNNSYGDVYKSGAGTKPNGGGSGAPSYAGYGSGSNKPGGNPNPSAPPGPGYGQGSR